MIVEGVLAIQAGANPRMVDQKLRALLPPAPAAEKKAA
jgi:chemotaxis protein MotA